MARARIGARGRSLGVLQLLAIVALSGAVAGCGEPASCATACDNLSACGLLPSALAIDRENCMARCANTDDELRRKIVGCAQQRGSSASWCDTDLFGGALSCADVAECLDPLGPAVLGEGEARFAIEDNPMEACREPAGCDPPAASRAPSDICRELRATSVEAFVERPRDRRAVVGSCESIFAGAAIAQVPSGRWSTGIQIRGTFPNPETSAEAGIDPADAGGADDAGADAGPRSIATVTPYCFVVYGPVGVVGADRCNRIAIPAPERGLFDGGTALRAFPCEAEREACRDGIDNDEDGQADCLDTQCRSFCGPSDRPTSSPADAGD
jgi:hypothetical protein